MLKNKRGDCNASNNYSWSRKWDEDKEEFVYTKSQTISLEHSLVSISNGNRNGVNHIFLLEIKQRKKLLIMSDV